MNMAIPLLLLAFSSAAFGAGDRTAVQRTPIRPVSDCLRLDQINEWHIVDTRTAIVRAGPHRFRVGLASACPRLGLAPAGLMFRPNPSTRAIGGNTICGEVGETVRSRNQPPCAIKTMTPIGQGEFDRLAAQSKRGGTAANQPTPAAPIKP